MASDAVRQFTDANFESEVLRSDQPVLVDFWAEWCQPCRMLTPTIEAIAGEYHGRAKVGKVDTDANREISVKYQISSIPTVLLFKNGHVEKTFVGLRPPRSGRPGPCRNSRRAVSTHSGHWNPTGAGIMQSGKIGRPHRVQCTRVCTFGWR